MFVMSLGELRFDETEERVGRSTTPAMFSEMRLAGMGGLSVGVGPGDRSVWKSDRRSVWGKWFHVTLEFVGPRLVAAELFLTMPNDGKDWSSWSHAGEMARKAAGERWAEGVFGKALAVKPIDVDGKLITPIETAESARCAVYAWGDIGSYYDAKGGMALLRVVYAGA
jgi:hypothetical protein